MEVDAPGETIADCTISAIDLNLFSKLVWSRDEATQPSATRPPILRTTVSRVGASTCHVQEIRGYQPVLSVIRK
jgi:hypothetical protein